MNYGGDSLCMVAQLCPDFLCSKVHHAGAFPVFRAERDWLSN